MQVSRGATAGTDGRNLTALATRWRPTASGLAAGDVQAWLMRRRQIRDAWISPAKLTVYYCLYLLGILLLHYVYYRLNFDCAAPAAVPWFAGTGGGLRAAALAQGRPGCPAELDWFGAAMLDNYAFLAVLVYPLLIAYLQLTRDIDTRFRDMVLVLAGRGVLRAARDDADEEHLIPLRPRAAAAVRRLNQIELRAVRWGERTGWLVLVAIALSIGVVGLTARQDTGVASWYFVVLGLLHAPLALPIVHTIGARLMRLVWYGIAVHRHRDHGVVPIPLVEHSDLAGGLKPLGDYFLGQAYRICLLSVFIIVATLFLLIKEPISYRMLYVGPQDGVQEILLWVFIGCSAFVLAMQLVGVVVPLWTVHLRMVERKRALLGRAAIMTRRRQRLLAVLSSPRATKSDIERDSARLDAVERWIENYEAFPGWPIPRGDLRNFWVMWGGSISAAFAMLATALFGEGAFP